MRVAINCRSFLKRQYTGIGRYAYHLVKSLSGIDSENQYYLYAQKPLFCFNKKLPHFKANNFIPCLDRFNRGSAKVLKNIDIFHCPSPSPINMPDGAKVIVTVHDVIFKAFPEGHTQDTIEIGQRQFENIRNKATKIICCSKSTVNDLKKYFQIPDEKIALVYQGVDKDMFYPIDRGETALAEKALSDHGIKGPFILSVGTIEPRKNLKNLIHAFNELKTKGKFVGKLVIVGMKGWKQGGIHGLIEELHLEEDIIFVGFISDRELCYLYNMTEVFVFPSFYEGFGFPIVEAFSCGAPVVTSNVSSCAEIAEDAALTVDPNSPEAIADAIYQVLADDDLKELLKNKGKARAKDFDFDQTARETLKIYQDVYQS